MGRIIEDDEAHDRPRRWARVSVGAQQIAHLVAIMHERTPTYVRVVTGLPSDAKLVRFYPEFANDSLMLVFEHKSFKLVPEGEEVPLLFPTTTELLDLSDSDVTSPPINAEPRKCPEHNRSFTHVQKPLPGVVAPAMMVFECGCEVPL